MIAFILVRYHGSCKFVKTNKIFPILAILRRSVEQVGGAHLGVFAPAGNTASFKEILEQWRPVSDTMSDLTDTRFEPQTSQIRDVRDAIRPTGRRLGLIKNSSRPVPYQKGHWPSKTGGL